jgi:hypothetical protein
MSQPISGFRRAAGAPLLALLIVIGASACRETTAPSAELPIEFRRGFGPVVAPSGSIGVFGRDVIAVMARTLPCNFQTGGSAALIGDRLEVSITLIDLGPVPCAALPGSSVDSVVVHGVPAGAYDASLHLRIRSEGMTIDSTIARQAITKGS